MARMKDGRGAYRVLVWKSVRKKHLEDSSVDGNIIISWICKNCDEGHIIYWYGLGYGQVAGCCKRGNLSSDYIKKKEFSRLADDLLPFQVVLCSIYLVIFFCLFVSQSVKIRFIKRSWSTISTAVNIYVNSVTNRQSFRSRHTSPTPSSWRPNCWRCACKHRRFPISGKTVIFHL